MEPVMVTQKAAAATRVVAAKRIPSGIAVALWAAPAKWITVGIVVAAVPAVAASLITRAPPRVAAVRLIAVAPEIAAVGWMAVVWAAVPAAE